MSKSIEEEQGEGSEMGQRMDEKTKNNLQNIQNNFQRDIEDIYVQNFIQIEDYLDEMCYKFQDLTDEYKLNNFKLKIESQNDLIKLSFEE